jgi:hypothetical protein
MMAPGKNAAAMRGGRPLRRLLSCIALLSIACTLTRDDFEPSEVSSLGSDPNAGVGSGGTDGDGSAGAADPPPSCFNPDGCCASADDCSNGEECANGACVSACAAEDVSTCAVALAESCTDGVQNGREPAIDCGESCPVACATDSACNDDRDCTSGRCVSSRCAAPSCDDEARNQDESGVDCGGSCDGCTPGQPCQRDEDCASGLFCPPSSQVCTDGSCQDGERSGSEVLVDCGGGECPGCPPGSPCTGADDCDSRVCSDGSCQAPSCNDGLPSGDETGVDCGGGDLECPRCPDEEPCRSDADCANDACEEGTCISCSDGTRNGSETAVDCGGGNPDCSRCDDGGDCVIAADCASGRCLGGSCAGPSCSDGVQNGTETDTDCGGNDLECSRCPSGDSCQVDGDCASQNCTGQVCISCGDGVRNGGETDIDCGGADPACIRCAPGDTCSADADCASGACQNGTCCGGSQGDCTRCAQRLSPTIDCNVPAEGVDSTGVINCNAFLGCLSANAARCPTRNTPGCSGDNQATDACPHNNYGGNAGTGITRANQVLVNASCQL